MTKEAIRKPFKLTSIPGEAKAKHIMPTSHEAEPHQGVRELGSMVIPSGLAANRVLSFGVSEHGDSLLFWLSKVEGDDAKLGWDRYLYNMDDLAAACLREAEASASLLAGFKKLHGHDAQYWRLGRHRPLDVNDANGAPISHLFVGQINPAIAVRLYVIKCAELSWRYIIHKDNGEVETRYSGGAPLLPMFAWV